MTKSQEPKSKGDLVAISEGGKAVFLASTLVRPKKRLFPDLAMQIAKRMRLHYKVLLWSPFTRPKPEKFTWDTSKGEYSTLP